MADKKKTPAQAAGDKWKAHTDLVRLEVTVVGVDKDNNRHEMGTIFCVAPRLFKANAAGLCSMGFNVNGKLVDLTEVAAETASKGFQLSGNVVAVKSREWA